MTFVKSRLGVPTEVLNLVGKYPRVIGVMAGCTLMLCVFLGFAWVAMQLRVRQVDADHGRLFARMRDAQSFQSRALDLLNEKFAPQCDAETLRRLRIFLFEHRSGLHVGLLDERGRLFCTTSNGKLDPPVVLNVEVIDGSVGQYLMNFPRKWFTGREEDPVKSTVLSRGSFVLWPNNASVAEAFDQYSDAVWAGNQAQRRRVYLGRRGSDTDEWITPQTPHLQFALSRGLLRVTNLEPGVSPISTQSVVYFSDLYYHQPFMLAVIVGLCALLGWSLGWAVNSLCRVLGSLDFRIRSLCASSRVVCHYQPIVDLSNGRVVGCEVLARLQDGPRLLYPDEFIPALNRKKLTWALDAAVSQRALMELGTSLPHLGNGFIVALNFFPGSLNRDRIHAHLQKALQAVDRSDFQIKLEITEYEFSETMEPEIVRLREDGYRIAIDDFGTGYSNLGIVKRISPDELKIDKSFVFEMEDITVRSSLIPEIVGIARAIRCDVVAEGIETASQANRLLALGVRYGQGYYFLRPAPIDKFLDYLQSGDLWTDERADLKL